MGLRIKPLKWAPSSYGGLFDSRVEDWVYVISEDSSEFTLDGFEAGWGHDTDRRSFHPDLESAQAAANEHHKTWLMHYLEECND